MRTRPLGASGLEVSALCFGGNVLGWTADEATAFRVLDTFVAAGGNFIDTADVYSIWVDGHAGGESEAVLGRWMQARGNRHRLLIATKVGMDMGPRGKGLSRAHILASIDASLARLRTDCVDLYQSHIDDGTVPLEETLATYAELVQAGKVRVIGASNHGAARLAEAIAVSVANGWPRYQALQPLYNLCDRTPYETELEPVCRAHAVAVIPFYSLAAGFLTGKYRSEADLAGRARGSTVSRYLNERGLVIVAALERIAASHGATPARVALAWLLQRPGIVAPIVSATSVAQMEDIAGSVDLALEPAELAALDAASARPAG